MLKWDLRIITDEVNDFDGALKVFAGEGWDLVTVTAHQVWEDRKGDLTKSPKQIWRRTAYLKRPKSG